MENRIVELPNGEIHTLISYRDFKDLVVIKLGHDCEKIVDDLIAKSHNNEKIEKVYLKQYTIVNN